MKEWILRYPDRTGRAEDQIIAFTVYTVEDDSPPLGERLPRNVRFNALLTYP